MDNSRNSYLETLNLRQKKLEEKIKVLDRKIANAKLFTRRAEIEKLALKRQINEIAREKINYNRTNNNKYHDSFSIHGLDKVYDHQSSKERELKIQIDDLKSLKKHLKESGEKRHITKKIAKKQQKLARLKKREARVSKMQRAIIMTKRAVHRKKYKLSKQEAKAIYYGNKEKYMHGLKENLQYSNTITGRVKKSVLGKIYDHKEKKYRKKHEKRKQVVEMMKNKRFVGVFGANVMIMGKRAINKFRVESSTNESELNQMFNEHNNQNMQNNQHSR